MSFKETVLNAQNTHLKIETSSGISNSSYSCFLNKKVSPATIARQLPDCKKPTGIITRVTITYIKK